MMGARAGAGGCWGAGMSLTWMDCSWMHSRKGKQAIGHWLQVVAYSGQLMNMCFGLTMKNFLKVQPRSQLTVNEQPQPVLS